MITAPGASRRSRRLLVAAHVPLLVVPALLATSTGIPSTVLAPLPAAAVGVVFAAPLYLLQLRHSVAAARGTRPLGWPWTLLGLAVTLLPLVWLQSNWLASVWALTASVVMLLPVRVAAPVVVVVLAGVTTVSTVIDTAVSGYGAVTSAADALYSLVVFTVGGAALVAVARLVRLVDELDAARTDLAELVVEGERLRLSRDLHDLLGQSLSAVSLKGDLALRLWGHDRGAALAEVESLTALARGALRDVRAVTFDVHPVSLRAELDGAVVLLAAAGVCTRLDVAVPDLSEPLDAALGWVLREGVTNILRHSEAQAASIRVVRGDGVVRLELVNDGASGGAAAGGGLIGVAERIRQFGGVVDTGPEPGGRFRLAVRVPS